MYQRFENPKRSERESNRQQSADDASSDEHEETIVQIMKTNVEDNSFGPLVKCKTVANPDVRMELLSTGGFGRAGIE